MRPDEHKKKKSAAYKKKHTATTTKATASGQHDRKNVSKPNNIDDKVEVEEPESFSDVQFKKRTLQSNWERYEEKEEIKTIGSTYEELLSSATDPSSNLILDVEKDWENYPDFDTELFGIDCHHIHTMLENFDFCDRFDFDSRDIDPELLELVRSPNASKQVENISDVTIVRDVMLDRKKIEFIKPSDLKGSKREATRKAIPTKSVDCPVEGTTPKPAMEEPAKESQPRVEISDDVDKSFFADVEKSDSATARDEVVGDEEAKEDGGGVEDLEDWLDSII